MCLHKRREILGTTMYCELIEEYGEEACPKEKRIECLSKLNPTAKSAVPQNIDWFLQADTLLNKTI